MERAEDLLIGLTPSQIQAVCSDAAPLCVVAAAGAGKTRVLTRRIAYRIASGTAEPDHVLALTFTRKAATELRDRLRAIGLRERITGGTFHSVAAAQLRRWWADRGVRAPALLERKSRLLGPLADARPALRGLSVGELAAHLDWAQARLISPDRLEAEFANAGRQVPVPSAELAGLYRRYQDEKRRRGLVDFDDLLEQCASALETDPAFAAAQRWRWRHLFVDEYQDLNPLQYRLLRAWLGSSSDLCVVGDPHQAIYGWNGADPALLDSFAQQWPSAEVVRLDENHRCSPQIVAAAAGVLGPSGATLRSGRPDGAAPDTRSYPSEQAEASGVASGIARAHAAGVPWSQMAVLTRTNAQLIALRETLAGAGIPVRLAGHGGLLDQPLAKRIVATLGRRVQSSLQEAIGDLAAAARDDDRSDEDRAVFSALGDLAAEYQRSSGSPGVAGFLAWLPTVLAGPAVDSAETVTLCSFHRAKGLEWREVWVCGLEQGFVPIGPATTEAALAEEQRLLYVALTRAAEVLHCSWAERRSFGAKAIARQPSPWIAHLTNLPLGPREPEITAEQWKARLAAQRDRLANPGPAGSAGRSRPSGRPRVSKPRWADADPDLLAALQAWRSDVARGSGVPRHVVLHDSAMAALAALAPRTHEDLLAVPGLGPVKATRYGPALLAIVAGHTDHGRTDAASAPRDYATGT